MAAFMRRFLLFLMIVPVLAASCARVPRQIEPLICSPAHPKETRRELGLPRCVPEGFSLSPFAPLTPDEQRCDWGKEYSIALWFANDFDLYRAITSFKRALCLLPPHANERRSEIEYSIALAYFLGEMYSEVIYSIETTSLIAVDDAFPAFYDLLLIMYESYDRLGRGEHAAHILSLIEQRDPATADSLSLLAAVRRADFEALCQIGASDPARAYLGNIVCGYEKEAKSIGKAQALNAILPGAGYWYVGMRNTAVTALLVNSLFIAATAYFFDSGNWAAGAITLSLEGGWYVGGINGAGYAAKYYNEQLFCKYADKIAFRENYFPVFMLNYSF